MVKSCWICKTEGNKHKKSYFRIPKTVFHRNREISELSALRKEKWRDVLHLPDDTSGIRICSDHFLSGNPARLLDINDPDWIPTRNLKPKSVKKNKALSVACEKADEIICRLCFKLVSKELCVNIFHNVDKEIGMIATILGHKISVEEGPSPHACNSCLKKVRVCARLLTYFRRNEKRYLESVQNNGMESPKANETCQNGRNQGGDNKTITLDAVGTRTNREDETMENETGCDISEDVLRICSLYDHEQIRSIIDDNSVSSQESLTEAKSLMKCKRRKYNIHSVAVRPIEIKTLKCNNCYSKFDDLDVLKNHKNFCKLFHCQLCKPQIIFTEKLELEKHKKKYHCHSLVCHICGKNYSQSYLVKHFRNHFEQRRKCPFCGKTLKNMTIFMTHLDNVHGSKFSTVCEVCGGNFRNLKKHLVVCRKSGS